MTINYCYQECNCECYCARHAEKKALESYSWKQRKAFISSLTIAPYTLFLHLNKRFSRNLLRKTSIWISSNYSYLCMVHWSYSLRRKMVHCASMLTFAVLTISPRRIVIHFCSSLIYQTHLTKLGFIQRQIFDILTIWFVSLMVMNERLLLGHTIDYLNGL